MRIAELTKGEMFFYGGIVGIGVLIVISILLVVIFKFRKKRLMKKIESEY